MVSTMLIEACLCRQQDAGQLAYAHVPPVAPAYLNGSSWRLKAPRCPHQRIPRAATLEVETERAAEQILELSEATSTQQEDFDWSRQWYPLAFVHYLDPKVPHPVELLGVRLVLWRDAQQQWRCFEDKCPHRLAPLSEGRIEPGDGTLMCSYHGWRFAGDGRCTDVPQSLDAKANAAACASPRSCAVGRPTKVLQGMIFVWGSSGPSAAADSSAKPVPGMPEMEQSEGLPDLTADGERVFRNLPPYFRQMPYGWEVLAENLLDPSHLPYAHSGVLNSRDDPKAGFFRMAPMRPEGACGQDTIAVSGESIRPVIGDIQKRAFQLDPPSLIRWRTMFNNKPESGAPWINFLAFYVVPNGPQRSSVVFQAFFSERGYRALPAPLRLMFRLRPKWATHLFSHNVFDGDSKILYMQERILAQHPDSWRANYFMPAQADRLVAGFRKWLDVRGGGGPPTRLQPGAALPPLAERQEAFLDRYDTHTRHCPVCSGALRGFQRLQAAAMATGALCMLALSSVLGRGVAPLSAAPLGLLAGAVACLAAWYAAAQILKRFTFLGYNHSEK